MTKQELLTHLNAHSSAFAVDIANMFDLTIPAAGMALLRLTRQSLAVRHVDPTSCCYWYALTSSGVRRLHYYNTQ